MIGHDGVQHPLQVSLHRAPGLIRAAVEPSPAQPSPARRFESSSNTHASSDTKQPATSSLRSNPSSAPQP